MNEPEPPSTNSSEEPTLNSSSPHQPRKGINSDEWIAIGLVLVTMGSVFWWGLRKPSPNWLTKKEQVSPSTVVQPETREEELPQSTNSTKGLFLAPEKTKEKSQDSEKISPKVIGVPSRPKEESPTLGRTRVAPQRHWVSPFAENLLKSGYLKERLSQNWQPERPISRAEFATLIVQVFEGSSGRKTAKEFPDLPTQELAKKNINQAVEMGFLQGYAEGVFRPRQTVTRLEILVALTSGLNLKAQKPEKEITKVYQDEELIPSWALSKIAAATEAGLVVSYPDSQNLNPNQDAVQAEALAMVHQALVISEKLPKISSKYIINSEKVEGNRD